MNAPAPLPVDPQEFAGRRVLVTGGTKGTGEAIVRRFAAADVKGLVTDHAFVSALRSASTPSTSSRRIS